MQTEIFNTREDFDNRKDKTVNGVSPEFAGENPNYKSDNKLNTGCWNCAGCAGCYYCTSCFGCFGCFGCVDCYDCHNCTGCANETSLINKHYKKG